MEETIEQIFFIGGGIALVVTLIAGYFHYKGKDKEDEASMDDIERIKHQYDRHWWNWLIR